MSKYLFILSTTKKKKEKKGTRVHVSNFNIILSSNPRGNFNKVTHHSYDRYVPDFWCNACRVTVEEECYKYEQFRYHATCLRCGRCKVDLARTENKFPNKNQYGDKKGDDGKELNDAYFDLMAEMALCANCKTERATKGFKKVTSWNSIHIY